MLTDQRPLLALGPEITREFSAATSREWLETNGLGGWSSSTVAGAHTRRYHGLLVAAMHPPVDRRVLLSRLDETLRQEHEQVELGCAVYPGAIQPRGYRHLTAFALAPFPVFTYDTGDLGLRKTVAMIHGEHTVVILYELLRAPGPVSLELRPFFAGRDYHHLVKANDAVFTQARFESGILHYQPYHGQPPVYLAVPGGHFTPAPDWYYNFEYAHESERGLDFSEDLFTPGVLQTVLEPGGCLGVIASLQDPGGRQGRDLVAAEAARRAAIAVPASLGATPGPELVRAADQFVARRGDDRYTILAGYHWFTDWGRDTMISLPGTCLVTGRFAEARGIFRAFAAHVSEGMIPNRFPDAGEQPDYNTVDATLW
ncbi:MAG: glycogen debranching enzyme N-terminal domain-containing protein, partial [Gemmatimonadota bacterium]